MKELFLKIHSLIIHAGWKQKFLLYFLFIIPVCYFNYFTAFSVSQLNKNQGIAFSIFSVIFLSALSYGLLIESVFQPDIKQKLQKVKWLILAAPLLFALKITFPSKMICSLFFDEVFINRWNMPFYWVLNAVWITFSIAVIHRLTEKEWGLFGFKGKQPIRLYIILIIAMIPLLLLASQLRVFQEVYPKAQVLGNASLPDIFIFESSYAVDFFTIELFFRGFLILTLSKALGRHCIIPVALFYFTIHLGKPMPEAISSFFGGIILGTISYHSKSIWGGWLVHVSIALLMELFGYLF